MYKGCLSYCHAKSNKHKVKITGIQFNKLEFLSEWNKSSIRIYPKNEKSNDSGGGRYQTFIRLRRWLFRSLWPRCLLFFVQKIQPLNLPLKHVRKSIPSHDPSPTTPPSPTSRCCSFSTFYPNAASPLSSPTIPNPKIGHLPSKTTRSSTA